MDSTIPLSSNELIESQLLSAVHEIEKTYNSDVITFRGPIEFGLDDQLRDAVEAINPKKPKVLFILETEGGSIEVTERMVTTLRHHYGEVDFLVPNYAYSAGTILAMSGDAILMDYYSVLGPIDPQVFKHGLGFVPALGYLEKYDELIAKAAAGTITHAEVSYLCERFDPAELHSFEQAREQTVSLLKEWLVKWKFKDWAVTATQGTAVTLQMKEARAAEIARKLNDTKHWHSHGRGIPMGVLINEVNLKIIDFSTQTTLAQAIRFYYKLLRDYLIRLGKTAVIHTRQKFLTFGG